MHTLKHKDNITITYTFFFSALSNKEDDLLHNYDVKKDQEISIYSKQKQNHNNIMCVKTVFDFWPILFFSTDNMSKSIENEV